MKNLILLFITFLFIACDQPSELKFKRISTGESIPVPNINGANWGPKEDTVILYKYITDNTWFFVENHTGNEYFQKSKKTEDTVKGPESMLERFNTRDYIYQTKAIRIK